MVYRHSTTHFGAGRRRYWRTLSGAALLLCSLGVLADEVRMNAEIDWLIDQVADSDCTFIRNGSEHDAASAMKHLQMKRERGRRYYDNTEQFIDRIASKSSWSGKDYTIRCGTETQTAREWFTARLANYRQDHGG
jgi:Family of unknown function (DUF5329)